MWKVLLVDPCTAGQAPVVSVNQPAPVFGGDWVSRPLPDARAPCRSMLAEPRHDALVGVLADEVLRHAVGGEEQEVVVAPVVAVAASPTAARCPR